MYLTRAELQKFHQFLRLKFRSFHVPQSLIRRPLTSIRRLTYVPSRWTEHRPSTIAVLQSKLEYATVLLWLSLAQPPDLKIPYNTKPI